MTPQRKYRIPSSCCHHIPFMTFHSKISFMYEKTLSGAQARHLNSSHTANKSNGGG